MSMAQFQLLPPFLFLRHAPLTAILAKASIQQIIKGSCKPSILRGTGIQYVSMHTRICKITILSVLLQVAAVNAEKTTVEFSPARIGTGPTSFHGAATFPKDKKPGDDLSVTAFCQAVILTTGATKHSYCFTMDRKDDDYARAAESAVDGAILIPATIDGEPVKVFMSFRALFKCEAGSCQILTVPNVGYSAKTYGHNYSSPQELMTGVSWFTRFKSKAGWNLGGGITRTGIIFSFSVSVDESGIGSEHKILNKGVANRKELRAALSAIKESTFIPGFVKGKPTKMPYFELLYFYR